jgi:hypothetical protein
MAILISTFAMYGIARHITKDKLIACIVCLLPFTQPTIRDWAFMGRTDMMGLMFGLLGIYVVVKYWNDKRLYWSVLFFALAFFTKQNMITGMIAVPIALFLQYRRKESAIFTLCCSALIIGGLCIGSMIVGIGFLKEMVLYNGTVPLFWPAKVVIPHLLTYGVPLLILLFPAIVSAFKNRTSLVSIWFVVALVIFSVMIWREGGYINYGIELVYATSLCVGIWLTSVLYKKGYQILPMYIILVIPMLWFVHAFPMPDAGYDARCKTVIEIIKDTDGYVVTENAGLILEAGKSPYNELFTYLNMTELGYWDDTQYIQDMISGKIEYLVLHCPATIPPTMDGHGHFSLEQMAVIKDNYHIVYDTFRKPGGGEWWYSFVVYEHNLKGEK